MPELIDSYKELERNLGIDLGIEELEAAYKAALSSGNWDNVEMHLSRIEAKIIEAEQLSYQTGATAAGKLMALDGKKGLGHTSANGTKYKIHLGGSGTDDQNATSTMKEALVKRGMTNFNTD